MSVKRFYTYLFLISALVWSPCYGATDGYSPKPDPISWRFVPTAMGPTTIYMRATTAIDVNNSPVRYYFECTDHPEASSGWVSDANYTATGLTPGTMYSFRLRACDADATEPNTKTRWSRTTPTTTTDADTTPPVLRLDFNYDSSNDDANTQTSFTKFIISDNCSEVNGVVIDLEGEITSSWRDNPCGAWEKYDKWFQSIPGDPCWYNPRAGERLYRDFIYSRSEQEDDMGVKITLWGLGVNRDCDITLWAYDACSVGANRVANWYANGTYIFDTNFTGGTTSWPKFDNQDSGAKGWKDLYKHAWSGKATSDELGRIILTSSRDPESPEDQPFAFVNAIKVEPNALIPFVPTKCAQHPVPFDGTEDVPMDAILEWKESIYAEKHDVYLGTNFNDVNDASRTIPLGVLVSLNHSTTTYTPPELFDTNTTYYWRIDEVNSAPDYTIFKGQVWSFTTHVPVLIATNPVPLDGAQRMIRDVTLSWEKGEYAEKHDVYLGTDFNDVNDANRTIPLGVLVSQDHSTTTYDQSELLDFNTTYYWRIDEVNAAPEHTIFKGDVWSFTTYEPTLTWRVDARCFLNGPPGSFDDISVKDPSIVYAGGKWHLFYTYVGHACTYCMAYANATTIAGLRTATHTSLQSSVHGCAPHIFWFEPQEKWYLIHYSDFSTNTDINDTDGWGTPQSMGFSDGIDHVCISDGSNVYVFYGGYDGSGTVKRRSTTVEDFPYNWSGPAIVATDTFEGPQVYKNIADGKYYMIIEDGEDVGRYYELWTADSLGGTWTKVEEQWAHKDKLVYFADHWTDQVSHGEIIRAGKNEKMEISDINRCQFLIQGVVDGDYPQYAGIPYNLGIIRQCIGAMGDLDYDYDVDFEDFAILASQWLQSQPPGIPSADFAQPGGDGIVDMQDLAVMLDNWLWEE